MKEDVLTDRQRRVLQRVAAGADWRSSALAEGYSKSFSNVIAHRIGKKPAAVKMIEAIQKEGCTLAAYDLAAAMAQAQEGIDFAKANGNSMAFIKGCELRSKLSGLLIDRIETVTLDLSGALAAARGRVFPSQSDEPSHEPLPAPPSTTEPNGRDPSRDPSLD